MTGGAPGRGSELAAPPPDSSVTLRGRHVFLRPVSQADYEFLRMLETSGPTAVQYRQQGYTLSPEQFVSTLWQGVIAHFVVVRRADNRPLGSVACFGADFRNGHAELAALLDPNVTHLGWPIEGMNLFVDYLFRVFPFRKLYGQVIEFNLGQFRSALGRFFVEEGRRREHHFFDGSYYDQVILAIYRRDWERQRARLAQSQLIAATDPDAFIDVEAFCAELARYFDLPPEEVRPDADLVDDLLFDSVQLYEVVLLLEAIGGDSVNEALIESLGTIADVHATYLNYRAHARRRVLDAQG